MVAVRRCTVVIASKKITKITFTHIILPLSSLSFKVLHFLLLSRINKLDCNFFVLTDFIIRSLCQRRNHVTLLYSISPSACAKMAAIVNKVYYFKSLFVRQPCQSAAWYITWLTKSCFKGGSWSCVRADRTSDVTASAPHSRILLWGCWHT